MSEKASFHFYLTHESETRTLLFTKCETIRSIKKLLRECITCETRWTPQQLHYTIDLYNQHYQNLGEHLSIRNLMDKGILCDGDDIYIIINVNSGRPITYFDSITKYLRGMCVYLDTTIVREDPNHNYMFHWTMQSGSYEENTQSLMHSY